MYTSNTYSKKKHKVLYGVEPVTGAHSLSGKMRNNTQSMTVRKRHRQEIMTF